MIEFTIKNSSESAVWLKGSEEDKLHENKRSSDRLRQISSVFFYYHNSLKNNSWQC